MKELKWSENMTLEEKVDAGFKLMVEGFKEVTRKIDFQGEEIKGLRLYVGQKFNEINQRFEKMDTKMDGVLKSLHCHDEDIAMIQKAVGQK